MEENEKDLNYWSERLLDVQKEARAYGFASVACIVEDDRFEEQEAKIVSHAGAGPVLMLGMAEYIKICAKGDMKPTDHV